MKELDQQEKSMKERESLLTNKEKKWIDIERGKLSGKSSIEQKKILVDLAAEAGECQICYEITDINFAITPCGHGELCENCIKRLKENGDSCPACRGKIDGYIKLYLNR